ncbi:hypothetical protein ACE6H2_023539 [Prunus campanulata]
MAHHQNNQNNTPNGFNQSQVVVVMVPLPAQGHLNQLLHFSRLVSAHDIPVYFVGSPTHNRQAKLRVHGWDQASVSNNVQFHDFQIPPFPSPPPNPNATNKFPSHLQPSFEATAHLRQPMADLLRQLSPKARRVIVIHDSMMASVIQDVASIPNGESYTFHTVSAFALFLYLCEAIGRQAMLKELHVEIPDDTPSLEGCFTNEFLDFIAAQYECQKLNNAGSIYNTSRTIEGPYMDFLNRIGDQKHWALGPFNPSTILKSVLITRLLRVGVVMRDWAHRDDILTSLSVKNGVEKFMGSKEGDEIRKRAADLCAAVRRSMVEGGASHMEFSSFIDHITRY